MPTYASSSFNYLYSNMPSNKIFMCHISACSITSNWWTKCLISRHIAPRCLYFRFGSCHVCTSGYRQLHSTTAFVTVDEPVPDKLKILTANYQLAVLQHDIYEFQILASAISISGIRQLPATLYYTPLNSLTPKTWELPLEFCLCVP